jgi:hypothetical protein
MKYKVTKMKLIYSITGRRSSHFIKYTECLFTNMTIEGQFMQQMNFEECDFRDVTFVKCDLSFSVFEKCLLENVRFVQCRLNNMRVNDNKWGRVEWDGCHSCGDFIYSDLKGLSVEKCLLLGNNFSNSDLTDARFIECRSAGLRLNGTIINSTCFSRGDIRGINFFDAVYCGPLVISSYHKDPLIQVGPMKNGEYILYSPKTDQVMCTDPAYRGKDDSPYMTLSEFYERSEKDGGKYRNTVRYFEGEEFHE